MSTPTSPRRMPPPVPLSPADEPAERPSKSQRKRAMHELQDLGERLLTLPAHQIAALHLPEPLADAIHLARRITAHEGRRRQLQLIGRLMRSVDAQAIRAAITVDEAQHRAQTLLMHQAEHWREQLLNEPEQLAVFLSRHPAATTLGLHTLIRCARTEVQRAQHGRHYRELYRVLRTILASAAPDCNAVSQLPLLKT